MNSSQFVSVHFLFQGLEYYKSFLRWIYPKWFFQCYSKCPLVNYNFLFYWTCPRKFVSIKSPKEDELFNSHPQSVFLFGEQDWVKEVSGSKYWPLSNSFTCYFYIINFSDFVIVLIFWPALACWVIVYSDLLLVGMRTSSWCSSYSHISYHNTWKTRYSYRLINLPFWS